MAPDQPLLLIAAQAIRSLQSPGRNTAGAFLFPAFFDFGRNKFAAFIASLLKTSLSDAADETIHGPVT